MIPGLPPKALLPGVFQRFYTLFPLCGIGKAAFPGLPDSRAERRTAGPPPHISAPFPAVRYEIPVTEPLPEA